MFEKLEFLQKKKREQEILEREEARARISWVLSDQKGVDFIKDILNNSNVFQMSFNNDPLIMAFNEGKRNVGNQLLSAIIEFEPKALQTLMTENNND